MKYDKTPLPYLGRGVGRKPYIFLSLLTNTSLFVSVETQHNDFL